MFRQTTAFPQMQVQQRLFTSLHERLGISKSLAMRQIAVLNLRHICQFGVFECSRPFSRFEKYENILILQVHELQGRYWTVGYAGGGSLRRAVDAARGGRYCPGMNDDDDNDRVVVLAKRTGRVFGFVFVLYLIFSIGQQLKVW